MIPSSASVRVAVVGVGQMGANHARVYSGLKGAELVAVVDAEMQRAEAVAKAYDCEALPSVEELGGRVDAASVVVPSVEHAEIGGFLLDAGIHCLIEKPLATTEADCRALIEAAERGGQALCVGHIERFNPAVLQLREILAVDHDLCAVDARRMSAVSSRVTDVDVVADLMIHDIDIILDLVGSELVDVYARGAHTRSARREDHVTALLSFANGTLATATASRVTQNQIRELQVTTHRRFFTVDYSAQELLIYRQGRIGPLDGEVLDGGRYVLDVGTERVFIPRAEPLVVELGHFVDVVRGEAEPKVGADSALRALQVAWEIQDQIRPRRRR